MSCNRFQIIDYLLHFAENEKIGKKYPLAAKIHLVCDYYNEKFQSIYNP